MLRLPPDHDARDRAMSPRVSFHLEAPAGSGKTSVLLSRFLTLLAQVDAPDELLALTFTRKAAGELRTRVMRLLMARQDPGHEASPLDRQLFALAEQVFRHYSRKTVAVSEVLAPERLPIMTFHSFCAQLVRLAPQEAGVPLDFQLMEEDDVRWLRQEAVEELRRRLAGRPERDPVRQALVRRLLRLNNDWPRLARELRTLLARRDSLGEFLELARVSREPEAYLGLLEERFRQVLQPHLQTLAAGVRDTDLGARWQDFWNALRGSEMGDHLPPRIPGTTPPEVPAWQAVARVLLTQGGDPRKQLTGKHGFPENLDKATWAPLIRELPASLLRLLKQCRDLAPAGASPEEAAALQDLVILLAATLGVYGNLCAQRQALDFIALEQATLNLLTAEDPGDLLLRLDRRLNHLLVDEFQDTSLNQMILLCRLMAGWQNADGRTLMVVGDPKQSIYGWRQARVRLFLESRQGLPCPSGENLPLEPLLLTTNFRATRTLITWVNAVFGRTVITGGGTADEIAFHAAAARPEAPEGPTPSLALFTGEDDRDPREAEARWLARQVAAAVPTLKDQETIGVLLFTRTHLPVYVQAFHDAGLAVRVREGLKLTDSRVAAHLHNLARALTRPQDDVAWVALLRGPWAPQTLSTLARVAQTPEELWPEKLRRFAGESVCPANLAHLIGALGDAQAQVGRRPLAVVIRDWLAATAAWPGLAAWEGPAGVANARAYLDLLADSESGLPEATFQQLDFRLQEAFQPPDPRAQDSPVELLTVHGAKGLEFHHVFLPFCDWQPLAREGRESPPFLLEEIPGAQRHGLALARPYIQEKQSALYLLLKQLRDRRILDEAKRVFYVAVTRAQERLMLSGVVKRDKGGEWQVPGESPLGWLWRHYQPALPTSGAAAAWSDPDLRVELMGEVPTPAGTAQEAPELPPAWEFRPEAAPYQLSFPSQLAPWEPDEDRAPSYPGIDAEAARLRGEMIHRGLETLATGGALPTAAAMAAALRQAGMAPDAAAAQAPEMLTELEACRDDPFLGSLLAPGLPVALSEWLLEDQAAPGIIRRGRIDRLVFDGEHWWLLDYKTSRPPAGEDWDDFIIREKEKYLSQLLAYREMAARARDLESPASIKVALYFTACRRAVQI